MDTTIRLAARRCQALGQNWIRKEADMEQDDTSEEMENSSSHTANSSMMARDNSWEEIDLSWGTKGD